MADSDSYKKTREPNKNVLKKIEIFLKKQKDNGTTNNKCR